MYPELVESGLGASRGSKYAYYHTPGVTLFSTLPTGPVRAMWGGNNRLFVMGGANVYELNSAGAVIGTFAIGAGTGPGQIIGGPQPGVSAGAVLLVWDGTTNPAVPNTWVITGVGAPTAVISSVGITYINGYYVALRPGGSNGTEAVPINTPDQTQFNWSAPLDPFTWDPLDFIIKSSSADAVLALLGPGSFNGGPEELWLMGKKTISIWYQAANPQPQPPFNEVHGAFMNAGIWGAATVVGFPNTIAFLSADDRGQAIVMATQGYRPVRISDHNVENTLRDWVQDGLDLTNSDVTSIIAYGYQEKGHQFLVLTNTLAAAPQLVYDFTTRLWHERAAGSTPAALTFAPGAYHATAFGKHFLGDQNSGKVWVSDLTAYQQESAPILRMRVAPHLNNERKKMFYSKVTLDVGGPFSSNRNYTLESSTDQGVTYGPQKVTVIGPTGDSPSRIEWRRPARDSRDCVFRVTSTNNGPETWVDGYVQYEPGTED